MRGRNGELAELDDRLRATCTGGRQIVVVDGPAGSGRTTLLEAAATAGRRSGLRVATVRAERRSGTVPFAAVRRLATSLGAEELRRGSGADPTFVLAAVEGLVQAVSPADIGLCLVVDDAHYADVESLQVLVHLGQHALDVPLAVVLSVADGWAPPPVAVLLDELRAKPESALLRLRPLAHADGEALVADRLGSEADPAFCEACVVHCGGNPLLLAALADDLVSRGVGGAAHEQDEVTRMVPDRIRAVISSRLAVLGAAPTALARALAVLGGSSSLRRVIALAELDRRAGEDAADALVRTGLCQCETELVFVEPIVSAAVGADHEPFARKRWHHRAAELFATEHEPVVRVADHLLEAVPSGEAWTVGQLVSAASAVSDVGDCRKAAAYLRRALAEPPPAEVQASVLADLAFAESRSGAAEAPARIESALEVATTSESRVSLLREQARLMWLTGRLPDAVRCGERALAETSVGTELHAMVLAELLAVASMHDVATIGEHPALANLLEQANGGWVPDSAALAATLATVLPLVQGDHRRIPALIDRALADDLWRLDAPPFGLRPDFVIGALQFADELERAAGLVSEGLAIASRNRDAVRVGLWNYWRAEINYWLGDLDTAITAATRAIDASAGSFMSWLGFSAATMAHAHLDRGGVAAARDAVAMTVGRVDPAQLAGIATDNARVRILTVSGEADEGLRLALEVGDRLATLSQRDGPIVAWRPVAAEAALAAGATGLACELAEEEVAIARATCARGRLGRALRIATVVTDEADGERLEEAVAVLATTPRQLDRTAALVDLGVHLHGTGRTERARDVLGEARELAEQCGARPLAARALRALHATGARPRRTSRTGPDALTTAERRVVELAAKGFTNRQIADDLVLGNRTVEWHLGRAYAKLGVRTRNDLRGALEGEG